MNKTKIIIVNENDQIIGYKKRGTLNQSDIYRVSALWIQNSKGDILLTQRKFTKKNDPGKWQPAVAGTNEKGESYKSNIIKETEEEIGLKNHLFRKAKKTRYSGEYNFFGQWFVLITDKKLEEFTIQEAEIEEIKWFKKEELLNKLKENPDKFVSSVKDGINLFYNPLCQKK